MKRRVKDRVKSCPKNTATELRGFEGSPDGGKPIPETRRVMGSKGRLATIATSPSLQAAVADAPGADGSPANTTLPRPLCLA